VPITITAGGRYDGCFRSEDPAVPAVAVTTTERVVIHDARIEHAGEGLASDTVSADIVVRDTRFVALAPETSEPVEQRAVALFRPAAFVASYNRFSKGHGISINADEQVVEPLRIRFNVSIDIGRFGHPTEPNCCVQFLQLDKVRAAAAIAWNKTSNEAGRSSVEDNINLHDSSGLGPEQPLDVHHNLISGAYPESALAPGADCRTRPAR